MLPGEGNTGTGHPWTAAAEEMLKTPEVQEAQMQLKGEKGKNSWCFKQGTVREVQIQWWG